VAAPAQREQVVAQLRETLARRRHGLAPARLALQLEHALSRALDREALCVQQVLDREDRLEIAAPVHALLRARLRRRHRLELGFPEAQHVRLDADQLRDLADPEVRPVGDLGHLSLDCFDHRCSPPAQR
jgi:hypothetical protein